MFGSLQTHGLQHARLACPSPSPGAYPNSCPLSLDVSPDNHLLLCHPLLLLPSIFPSVRAFSEWLFASGGQCIGASVSTSVLPMNIQGSFPLGLTGLAAVSLLPKGLSRVFSNTTVYKHPFFGGLPSLWSSSRIHTWMTGKP